MIAVSLKFLWKIINKY